MTKTTDNLIVFTDFDGTVSVGDVGNRLFNYFSDGKSREPVSRWLAGSIDSRKCLIEEAAAMRDIEPAELYEFIDIFQIDPHFTSFVDFLNRSGIALYILSDGLDIYIKRLLGRNGLGHLSFYANRAELNSGRFHFEWPYFEESCGKCANCKGYHIRRLRRTGQKAVYIGDGKSDLCALPEADIIFAKSFLADYCRGNKIDYHPFDSFCDIEKALRAWEAKRPTIREGKP